MSENDKNKKSVWSDFWLGDDFEESYLPFDEDLIFESKDSNLNTGALDSITLKLASGRRAISNFVNILTGEDIPVYFWDSGKTGATDGKVVYLSADIVSREDFDSAVGLALHEGAHIVYTNFDLIKTLWGRISELYKLGKEIGLSKDVVRDFSKLMVNYVEDRYIDDFVFRTAPGYRPYYVALYNKYFNNDIIGKSLQSDLLRIPTLPAYECRIINLTNPATDLNALPGLRKIAEELSLKTISRLSHTKDRIKTAIEITKIVFSNIKNSVETQKNMGQQTQGGDQNSNREIVFDIRIDEEPEQNESENSSDKEGKSKSEKGGDDKNTSKPKVIAEDDDDIIGGESVEVETVDNNNEKLNKKNEDFGDTSGVTKQELKKIKVVIESQKKFLDNHGNVNKKSVSDKQKQILDIIEKNGIILVPVGLDLTPGNSSAFGIDCVVVKKLTKELLFSGMFPLYGTLSFSNPEPYDHVRNAVIKGIQLGTALGKKLQIRQEINSTKYTRKCSGKLDKRLLHELFCGNEDILHKMKYDKYDKLNLHISVDASGSMSEEGKWEKTMTMVVAIAKAASMINNLRVCISFRSTIGTNVSVGNSLLPYIVLAYDSAKDKFSKIKNLFPFLNAHGATPEGLCFEAIMKQLVCNKPGENHYFLNISDGEPCFTYYGPNNERIDYSMLNGADHTKKQYKKILSSGVKGMSYFIESKSYSFYKNYENRSRQCFKKMYGKDAQFIDVNSITAIAKTMNQLFLDKD